MRRATCTGNYGGAAGSVVLLHCFARAFLPFIVSFGFREQVSWRSVFCSVFLRFHKKNKTGRSLRFPGFLKRFYQHCRDVPSCVVTYPYPPKNIIMDLVP